MGDYQRFLSSQDNDNRNALMARKKKYEIEVVFSTSIYVNVEAEDKYDAMDIAEDLAAEEFRDKLDSGLLGTSDFDCEAQTP